MSKKAADWGKRKICDRCGRSFRLKSNLIKHLQLHITQENIPRTKELTCVHCNIVFKNKGLLVCHNMRIHEPKSVPEPPKKAKNDRYVCQACQINFFHQRDLKHHIREFHFNLLSNAPYSDFKKVNQVWFEKVLNSKNIVEIKKVAQNILLMRKLDDNTAMKVSSHDTEVIDLRDVYPTLYKYKMKCEYCLRLYDKGYINKHINDIHLKYNDKKFTEEITS